MPEATSAVCTTATATASAARQRAAAEKAGRDTACSQEVRFRVAMTAAQDHAWTLRDVPACARPRLHVPAILPKNLDSVAGGGYRRRLAARCAHDTEAGSTTQYPCRTATGVTPGWSASQPRMTRSRCDYGRLPSAKLFEAFGGDVPARALALSADLLLAQEPPNGLHVPPRGLRGLGGGVADAGHGAVRVRHEQIISNYRYLQRKIVVTNDCFMGY